ncbi:MAG: ATP-dependent zinc metalloprotease FtsH [Candidatus Dormibacteria bacterium]
MKKVNAMPTADPMPDATAPTNGASPKPDKQRDHAKPGRKGTPGGNTFRMLVASAVLLLVVLGLSLKYVYSSPTTGEQLSLDTVGRLADRGEVLEANFLEEDSTAVGVYCSVQPVGNRCPDSSRRDYWTSYLRSDASTADLISRLGTHALVSVDRQPGKAMLRFASQFLLPLLILANLFAIIFLAKSGQGGLGDLAGFGGIGRDRQRKRRTDTTVTFASVAGADEAVAELREVKDYLQDPQRYQAFGAQPPKGVLLFGAPGCGKTLLARAVAGESGVPFFSISGAEFVESLVGVGAARVRDLFRQVREVAPAIVFIDELDAAARRRGGDGGSGGEREQTLNQLLVEMDGFEVTAGIVVMGATNRPDIIDPALLRPGRFDRHITVEQPDINGRQQILELHARNKPMAPGVDFRWLAQATPGFTGADLANVINEGALLAIREGHPDIRPAQLTEAIQRVLSGPKRRGHLLTTEERGRVAYHEAGHAVVAALIGRARDVQRVSIVARGRGLGQSIVSTDADRSLHTRSEMADQMVSAMGGACAEELRFGELSTAAEDDIERVSTLAREMVGRYGMSSIGMVRMIAADTDIYLAGGGSEMVHVSEATLERYDTEVAALIDGARRRAADLLAHHRKDVEAMVQALDRVETLEGPDLEARLVAIRASAGPPGTPPPPPPPWGNGGSPAGGDGGRAGRAGAPIR